MLKVLLVLNLLISLSVNAQNLDSEYPSNSISSGSVVNAESLILNFNYLSEKFKVKKGGLNVPNISANGLIQAMDFNEYFQKIKDLEPTNMNINIFNQESSINAQLIVNNFNEALGVYDRYLYYTSCKAIKEDQSNAESGTYLISPSGGSPLTVFCEMEIADGGWTLVHNLYSATKFTYASNTGIPSLSNNYGSNNVSSGYNQIMVRYGTNYSLNVVSQVFTTKTLNSSTPIQYSGNFRLEPINYGSAAGCNHYHLDVQNTCSQGSSYSCYNTAEAGWERESSSSWCNSGFNGVMAVFVK